MERLKRYIRRIIELNIPVYASQASFFIVLSVFPTLVLLMGLLRYTGLEVKNLIDLLKGFLPEALMPSAQRLVHSAYRNTSGVVISFSALVALWSASRGVYGLLIGLNAIYGVQEDRGYWYTRGISVAYTFGLLVVLLLTLILNVFGEGLLKLLPVLSSVINLRFFLLLIFQFHILQELCSRRSAGNRNTARCIFRLHGLSFSLQFPNKVSARAVRFLIPYLVKRCL